jgi:hypothetical protein
MKKKILKSSLYIILSILVGVTAVYAVDKLTAPSAPANTMYSLTDIYNLSSGTLATEGTGDFITGTLPASGTGKTLTEVYTAIKDQLALLTADKLAKDEEVFGITGTYEGTPGTNYGIPKTGQTICNKFSDNYNSANQVSCTGTNQDGDLKKGIALSYTDNGNGTVTDNATGLTWQKCEDGQDPLTCDGAANTFLMDDGNGTSPAINYCESLNLADQTDWHLPNVKQLQSIVDYGRVSPAIDTGYFPNSSDVYWSSTAYLDGAYSAWVVSFYDGYVSYDSMDLSYFVRCVRE